MWIVSQPPEKAVKEEHEQKMNPIYTVLEEMGKMNIPFPSIRYSFTGTDFILAA